MHQNALKLQEASFWKNTFDVFSLAPVLHDVITAGLSFIFLFYLFLNVDGEQNLL